MTATLIKRCQDPTSSFNFIRTVVPNKIKCKSGPQSNIFNGINSNYFSKQGGQYGTKVYKLSKIVEFRQDQRIAD